MNIRSHKIVFCRDARQTQQYYSLTICFIFLPPHLRSFLLLILLTITKMSTERTLLWSLFVTMTVRPSSMTIFNVNIFHHFCPYYISSVPDSMNSLFSCWFLLFILFFILTLVSMIRFFRKILFLDFRTIMCAIHAYTRFLLFYYFEANFLFIWRQREKRGQPIPWMNVSIINIHGNSVVRESKS